MVALVGSAGPLKSRPGGLRFHPMKCLLVNPNTNVKITEIMVSRAQSIANELAGDRLKIFGSTALEGESLITDEPSLCKSAESVSVLLSGQDLSQYCGVIIAAFGDPGLNSLSISTPVFGIGESSIKEAKRVGRRFCIVSTTPLLKASMERQVAAHDCAKLFVGVFITAGEPRALMQSEEHLVSALAESCRLAIEMHGAETIIIGGGPLASAVTALQSKFPACLILDPIHSALLHLSRSAFSDISLDEREGRDSRDR